MNREMRSALLLFLTAAIWGFAMAFQREGSRYLGPFAFNACRFLLGGCAMLPLMLRENKKQLSPLKKSDVLPGVILGAILFLASLLQQAAVGEAGAGKAGFLTALYVVLVPLLGIFVGKKTRLTTWLALGLALPALYLLCVPAGESFSFAPSDLLLILGAVFWALHILCTDHFVQRISALKLCAVQFFSGAALNLLCALLFESLSLQSVMRAAVPLLYCGLMSTGLGYLLQTVGQAECRPAFAALILSLESVFCVIAGALMLGERMEMRGYIGCVLMLLAVLLAQAGALLPARKENRHV